VFGDGKKGRTTFTVDKAGNLNGKVRGSSLDWDYFARPVSPNHRSNDGKKAPPVSP